MCNGKYDYIMRSRIQDYQHDIEFITNILKESERATDEQKERLRQDQVIIQELTKIVNGVGLDRLSYVD